MSDRSGNRVVAVALGLILLLLLLVGGVGFYYLTARQQAALAVAREAETQARMMAAQARVEAADAAALRTRPNGQEASVVDGDSIRAAVESVLRTQEEAWNRGDVDAFMEHYWKSDDLTFSSEGKITRGWNATLNRYRERYPTRDKMGRVSFSGLEITPLSDSAAVVLGAWKLDRESEPVEGNFSIVFRKIDDEWVVVHDHTSRADSD